MTGATVVIKKNNDFYVGKVRHSGYDVDDFFKIIDDDADEDDTGIFTHAPEDLWDEYIKWRRGSMSGLSIGCEIITNHDHGYHFNAVPPAGSVQSLFDWAVLEAETQIELSDPDDGMLCGYEDYGLVVDYDNNTLTFV